MKQEKRRRVMLDVAMLAAFILLLASIRSHHAVTHQILGGAITALIAYHLWLNRKWIKIMLNKTRRSKVNQKAKYRIRLAAGLAAAFTTAAATGIGLIFFPDGSANHLLRHLHAVFALSCLVLLVLHLKDNWGYFKPPLAKQKRKRKRSPKANVVSI